MTRRDIDIGDGDREVAQGVPDTQGQGRRVLDVKAKEPADT